MNRIHPNVQITTSTNTHHIEFSLPHPGLCWGELKKDNNPMNSRKKPLPPLLRSVCMYVCVWLSEHSCLPVYPQSTWLALKALFNRNHTASSVWAEMRDWVHSWIKLSRNIWKQGKEEKREESIKYRKCLSLCLPPFHPAFFFPLSMLRYSSVSAASKTQTANHSHLIRDPMYAKYY